ncbi:hypothetical protein AB3X52_14400 [Nocardioides sp. DS6]|uniref:Transmembrane protein n=1 Tax=Nocardioides eburneus TaxID=3231482 RepID=A0ABV3T0T8_9ACTN
MSGSYFGAIVGLVVAAMFVPFAVVAARAQKKASAEQAAAGAGADLKRPAMEPGLLARKKLGVRACGGIVVFCALFVVLGLAGQVWPEAISFGLLGAFVLWILLRLRNQIRAAEMPAERTVER